MRQMLSGNNQQPLESDLSALFALSRSRRGAPWVKPNINYWYIYVLIIWSPLSYFFIFSASAFSLTDDLWLHRNVSASVTVPIGQTFQPVWLDSSHGIIPRLRNGWPPKPLRHNGQNPRDQERDGTKGREEQWKDGMNERECWMQSRVTGRRQRAVGPWQSRQCWERWIMLS